MTSKFDLALVQTPQDLEALRDTEAYNNFMQALAGTLWTVTRNDEAGTWEAAENNSVIEQFGLRRSDFEPIAPPVLPEYVPPAPQDPKLVGVEFDGVMCSATKEDQDGLVAVLVAFQLQGEHFQPTRFGFVNGSELVISSENIQRFIQAWMPFRQSFFAASE
jgi:hypothetical protein